MQKAAKCYLSVIDTKEALELAENLNSLEGVLRVRYSDFRRGNLRVVRSEYLERDNPNISPTDKCAIKFIYGYTSETGLRGQRVALIVIEEDGKVRLANDENV